MCSAHLVYTSLARLKMHSISVSLICLSDIVRFSLICFLIFFGLLVVAGDARAQSSTFTVLMRDFTLSSQTTSRQTTTIANQVRDAIASELQVTGQAQYKVITRGEMQAAAKTLGMRLAREPLQPAEITAADWLRLGRELKADAVITGEVSVVNDRKKGTHVSVNFQVSDVNDGELLNGGQGRQTVTPGSSESDEEALQRSAADAAHDAVQQMLQRPQITTPVLAIRAGVVTLAGGRREGLKPGDELNVYRYGAQGRASLTGRIRVTKIEESQSFAKVITNNGIGPEDVARKIYHPAPSPR
jgi:hypothetical protein